ncbi:MAG: AI-2E family transporter [Acidobacteriia bacterium]|nr:AI-2E family transporter [Terriglobia bacterium]
MPEAKFEFSPSAAAATSLRIIAAAIVCASIYYASSIVISLVCSIGIAFVLDPGVKLLERLRLPRWLGALLMVLLALAFVYLMVYLVYDRTVALMDDLPKLAARVRQIIAHIQVTASSLRQSTSTILPPSTEANIPSVRVEQESPWMQFLLRGIGSLYAFTVTVMFVPFLIFFMLTSKNHIWTATLNLFSLEKRQQAEDVLRGIAKMVRGYVLGNLLVAAISAALITPVFAAIQLRYALLMGPLAAFLSMIPYIGVALGLLPPLLIALVQYDHMEPFLTISLTVVIVHFLATNLLTPKLVGHRVKLNALTVTVGMMFWGWLWGGIGLLLAVPLTATLKAVCDNVRPLKPYGQWMGET